ncbi:MAG: pseudouridine synthase [Candidatus Gracilibacteria bacterium]
MPTRLQKLISESGYCSRRTAEKLITEGRVAVNGNTVTELGTKAEEEDKITINGKPIKAKSEKTTIILNKPAGVVTTKFDPFGEKTVMEILPRNMQYLNPIGRLDKDSEGLLLLTSDGELLNELTHPRYEHSKIYEVLIRGVLADNDLKRLNQKRLFLDGYYLQPMRVSILNKSPKSTLLKFILKEGRKRQIRRVMEFFGHPVLKLKRVAVGALELGDLKKGTFRVLTETEIATLKETPKA